MTSCRLGSGIVGSPRVWGGVFSRVSRLQGHDGLTTGIGQGVTTLPLGRVCRQCEDRDEGARQELLSEGGELGDPKVGCWLPRCSRGYWMDT